MIALTFNRSTKLSHIVPNDWAVCLVNAKLFLTQKTKKMRKQINQVKEFHNAFNIPIVVLPELPSVQRRQLRNDILQEEVNELNQAAKDGDIIAAADAIIDCLYVLIGTAHEFGLANILEQCFNEVHKSNMSKLGADGKPIVRNDGKVLKGENYREPDLSSIIKSVVSSNSKHLLNIPPVMRSYAACPSCQSENIYYTGQCWTCRECTYDWGGK